MGRILIIHSGLRGISNASLEIANRLDAAGHSTYFADMLNSQVKYEKSTFIDLNPIQFKYHRNPKDSFFKRKSYFKSLIDELNFQEFEQKLKHHRIDLVIIDMELHEYIIYLYTTQFKFVLLCQWFSIWQSHRNLPPFSSKMPRSYLQVSMLWLYSNLRGRIKTTLHHLKTLGCNRRQFILYLSKTLGFSTKLLISFHFPLPFSYNRLAVLSTTHPKLEFDISSRRDLNYIYPMVYENREETIPEDFQKIQAQLAHKNKKLIIVTRSSMDRSSEKLLPLLLEALSELDNCISIVSLGKSHHNYAKFNNESNVYIFNVIPQLYLFDHAHLSINHGGIHTINECIHFKLPMLILSGQKYDQNGCAVRVHDSGCGIALSPNVTNKDSIKEAIQELLNNEQYQNKVDELNAEYLDIKQNRNLELLVDSFLTSYQRI